VGRETARQRDRDGEGETKRFKSHERRENGSSEVHVHTNVDSLAEKLLLMRIVSWARLAPSLSSLSARASFTMAAAAPEARATAAPAPIWVGLLKQG